MRNFSCSQNWHDLDGNLLIGRVHFYRFHTTVYEEIFDVNGTRLANPVFTNQIGQLVHDVFLKNDTDYTVYFEKYIGNGRMEDDDDPTNWQFQYSSDNIFTQYVVDIQSEALQEVNNITDLRAISPIDVEVRDGHKIIRLLGYNEAGDKPEVLYIYDPNSIEADNGGSVIKPDDESTGRWILVNTFEATNGIDVRHLGVFGTYTREPADTMSAQIAVANNYATAVGIPLYFPRLDEGTTWYKMNNLVFKGMFAEGTRVYSKSGSHTGITLVKEIDHLSVYTDATYNGEFTIYGNVVRTSYGVFSNDVHFVPSEIFVIDSSVSTSNKTITGVAVRTSRVLYDWTFNSCTFEGVINHMGSRNTFINCRLTQLMFTDNFTNCVVNDTDIVDIEDWTDLGKWWSLRKQQSSRTLDMHNRTISNANVDLSGWTFCVIMNATLDNYVVHDDFTTIGFKNCTGTVTFSATHMETSFEYSTMTANFAAGNYGATSINNSNIVLGTVLASEIVGIYDSEVSGDYILQSPGITIKRSNVTVALDCNALIAETSTLGQIAVKVPSITRCILTGPINQAVDTAVVNFVFDGNTFREGSYHAISSIVPDTVVNGSWINNVSLLSTHFIVLNRTNLNSDERVHGYVYENNNGPAVLQKLKAKWNDNVILCGAPLPIIDSKQITHATEVDNLISTKSRMNIIDDAFGNKVLDTNIYLTECSFFSIGTNANVMNFKLTVTPERRLINVPNQYGYIMGNNTSVDGLQLASQDESTSVVAGIKFDNIYTWKIYQVYGLFDTTAPFWHSVYASNNWNVKVTYEIEYAGPASWGTNII